MRTGFAAMIAAMLGLAACGQADTAADTAKVTAPPTARLLEFCASEAEDYQDGFCTGYLLAYAYALEGRSGSGVCVPDNTSVRQIRDAAIHYLRSNPSAQQQDASIAIPAALRAGFPCKG
jgi:hypothetical protein